MRMIRCWIAENRGGRVKSRGRDLGMCEEGHEIPHSGDGLEHKIIHIL